MLRVSGTHPVEVLLVRRNDKVAFMAGAYVFPGGRVDLDDYTRATAMQPPLAASRFADLSIAQELPYRLAAVREMQEEASVSIRPEDLEPLAHWVTPDIEIRRYDTRFYLARMPAGQIARHDDSEMTELEWLSASQAVDRAVRGLILLPPPTWTTLKQISRFATVDAVFEWARTKAIVRVQPGFARTATGALLTLPGDPLHPTLPGWEIPEDTRFLLEGGKWKPARV